MKKIAFLGLLAVIGVAGVAAQASSGAEQAAKIAKCNALADARDFGIHEYQRHRFLIRCVAGLPQRMS